MDINTNRQSAAKLDMILKPFPIELDGYEDKYKVSNDGKIWSDYLNDFIKPYYSKGGYLRVKVNFGCKNKKFMVHRLVALAFIKNPNAEIYTQVDHIDCNRTNNCVENLRWVTPKQNTNHAIKMGNRNWYQYTFINPETNETLVFDNSVKACKYFGAHIWSSTLTTNANTGKPVTRGVFSGWIIERKLFKKVQRPSSAEEQGKAARNGNSPNSNKHLEWTLIWSDLYRNIQQGDLNLQTKISRSKLQLIQMNTNGSNQCRSF